MATDAPSADAPSGDAAPDESAADTPAATTDGAAAAAGDGGDAIEAPAKEEGRDDSGSGSAAEAAADDGADAAAAAPSANGGDAAGATASADADTPAAAGAGTDAAAAAATTASSSGGDKPAPASGTSDDAPKTKGTSLDVHDDLKLHIVTAYDGTATAVPHVDAKTGQKVKVTVPGPPTAAPEALHTQLVKTVEKEGVDHDTAEAITAAAEDIHKHTGHAGEAPTHGDIEAAAASMSSAPVTKKGILRKFNKMHTLAEKSTWKKRFFIVRGDFLLHYKEETDKRPTGWLRLSHIRSVKHLADGTILPGTDKPLSNGFQIMLKSHSLILKATSEQDRKEWMFALVSTKGLQPLSTAQYAKEDSKHLSVRGRRASAAGMAAAEAAAAAAKAAEEAEKLAAAAAEAAKLAAQEAQAGEDEEGAAEDDVAKAAESAAAAAGAATRARRASVSATQASDDASHAHDAAAVSAAAAAAATAARQAVLAEAADKADAPAGEDRGVSMSDLDGGPGPGTEGAKAARLGDANAGGIPADFVMSEIVADDGDTWHEHYDNSQKHTYWVNTRTGEMSWAPPEHHAHGAEGEVAGMEWILKYDKEGKVHYYYQPRTGEVSHEKPNHIDVHGGYHYHKPDKAGDEGGGGGGVAAAATNGGKEPAKKHKQRRKSAAEMFASAGTGMIESEAPHEPTMVEVEKHVHVTADPAVIGEVKRRRSSVAGLGLAAARGLGGSTTSFAIEALAEAELMSSEDESDSEHPNPEKGKKELPLPPGGWNRRAQAALRRQVKRRSVVEEMAKEQEWRQKLRAEDEARTHSVLLEKECKVIRESLKALKSEAEREALIAELDEEHKRYLGITDAHGKDDKHDELLEKVTNVKVEVADKHVEAAVITEQWIEVWSQLWERPYFVNARTSESVWEYPTGPGVEVIQYADAEFEVPVAEVADSAGL